jgi:flagellin
MLAIKNNMMAANAARYLGRSYDALAQSVERLSSGLRINSAKDDAAGMAVREMMRADIAVLQQGSRNAQDGISMLQTMEGAMGTIDNALVRMRQLAEQASTGSYSSAQRIIMNNEFQEMADEVDRIASSTEFNGISMLDNTIDVTIRFGTADDDQITVTGADMTKTGLGIETGSAGFEAMSSWGAATLDDEPFLTFQEDNVGADTITINVQFTDSGAGPDETAVNLTYAVAQDATVTLTLQELIDDINGEVGYTMASAQYDTDTNRYYLKVESEGTTADGLNLTVDAGTPASTHVYILDGGQELDQAAETEARPGGGYSYDGDAVFQEGTGLGINILSTTAAETALDTVTDAIGLKDTARAAFGYKINRLESTGEVLGIQTENLMTAESRISDVDVATEMAILTRNQVLSQAGTAMLAQANSIPQMALTLLR